VGSTAVAYRVPHPTYTIQKGTVIPCTDVTAIDTSSGGNVGVTEARATVEFPRFGSSNKPGLTRFGGVGRNPRTWLTSKFNRL
jgi:hypothetical protein